MPEPALTGWGRTAPTVPRRTTVLSTGDVLPPRPGPRGAIARGLGRSYGDAAQNAGGDVLVVADDRVDLSGLDGADPVVRVAAGVSLHALIGALLPTGHFVPVTPGTRQVSVGGAVAADVHGKNHHRDGSLGSHVRSITLRVADGSVVEVGPDRDPALFWATVGGMGLTGVVMSVELAVPRVETGYVSVRTERLDHLTDLMSRMVETESAWTHSVAWIDTLAKGGRLGRGVLTLGEHTRLDELSPEQRRDPWALPGQARIGVPDLVPPGAMSRWSIGAFNELWFRRAPRIREDELQTVATYFHPLDGVRDWNRLYGPRGFVQYQLVVPDGAEEQLVLLVRRIADAGHPSFLSVLKRFGPGNPAPLSFPMAGWTLALDLPVAPGLRALFDELDRVVADCGGRLYLAKDSRMTPEMLRRTYPRLDEFLAVRERVDPDRVFRSDLSRRLRL